MLGLNFKVSPKFGNMLDGGMDSYFKGETDKKNSNVGNNNEYEVFLQKQAQVITHGSTAIKGQGKKASEPPMYDSLGINAIGNGADIGKKTRGVHKCFICGAEFKKSRGLNKHCNFKHEGKGGGDTTSSNDFKCQECQLRFSTKGYLKRHYNLKHKSVVDVTPNENKCPKCELSFDNKTILREHYKENHLNLKLEDNNDSINVIEDLNDSNGGYDPGVENTVVEEENKKLIRKSGDLIIDCPNCNLKFKYLSNMLKHCERRHKGEEYACQDCNVKFSSKKGLGLHRSLMHTLDSHQSANKEEYGCQDCGAKFTSKKGLRRHIAWKHSVKSLQTANDEKVEFECNDCQKSFTDKSCLRRHIKHDHREEATYGCGTCYHITASKKDMMEHCEKSGHDLEMSYKIADSHLLEF